MTTSEPQRVAGRGATLAAVVWAIVVVAALALAPVPGTSGGGGGVTAVGTSPVDGTTTGGAVARTGSFVVRPLEAATRPTLQHSRLGPVVPRGTPRCHPRLGPVGRPAPTAVDLAMTGASPSQDARARRWTA